MHFHLQCSSFPCFLHSHQHLLSFIFDFPGGSEGKASAFNAGDRGSIPRWGRSPGEGNGKPLQYSCLENPMDGEAWWATVHGVTKSRTWLSDFTSLHFHPNRCESVNHSIMSDSVTPWTVACQVPLSMGFSRQEYWKRWPFLSLGNLPNPGIEPRSTALQVDSSPFELPGMRWYFIRVWICISLMLSDSESFLIHLVAICISHFKKCLLMSLDHSQKQRTE